MTRPLSEPERARAREPQVATASTVDVLAPRERVRGLVAARLFGDAVMPARIDRFELIRELGSGGMGAVYAAHDPRLDRAVALKVLARTGDGPQASLRLVREAQAMARLKHPNVVAVHEVGTHGEQVFVAMELVDGGTLASWIRGGPRPWREVLALLIPAGRGLAAAHAAGLVHRDFKPANVLIGADGRALVSDFGLARAGAEPEGVRPLDEAEATAELDRPLLDTPLTRTGALLGTPAYMSPEQFRGEMATQRSDVFSFCVVVWEAIFGQRPFTGATLADLIGAIEAGRIASPPRSIRIPSRLRRELLRGLAARAEDRHGSMAELLAALERAGRSSVWRGVAIGLGATVMSLIGVCGYVYTLSQPPPPVLPDWSERQVVTESVRIAPGPQVMARAAFLDVLGSREAVAKHAKVMSWVADGEFRGFKFYGIRTGSPLKELGFANGDGLVAIDGRRLTADAAWEQAMAAAGSDSEITLEIERKGERLSLVFGLLDAPGGPPLPPLPPVPPPSLPAP